MRPIVSCCGTCLNNLSRWLDHHFQKLKPFVRSYVRNNGDLLDLLFSLDDLPPGARLFTSDAVSMYTNIDTAHVIETISTWLDSVQLPANFPLPAVKMP